VSDRPDLIVVGDVMVDVSVHAGSLAAGGDVVAPGRKRAARRELSVDPNASLEANLAGLESSAGVAADIAAALCG
jgi:hypothetical protein